MPGRSPSGEGRADTIASPGGYAGTLEARLSGVYPSEQFTDDEAAVLRPYFTNLDGPVFALVNLPEVVKGALFARYSRSDKSLRRLFLDEFVGDLDLTGDLTVDATVGLQARRGALRPRVPRVRRRLRRAARRRAPRVRAGVEPAHEDPRVGPPDGVPRAVDALHPVRLAARAAATATTAPSRGAASRRSARATSPTSTRCSTRTARCCPTLLDWARERYPKEPADSDFVYKQTIKAKACDAVRGILPAATLSNVGIYGTGQAYEALLLRMRAHPLPEARTYAGMMLDELRKVIPSFLARVDRPDRGGAWSAYLAETAPRHRATSSTASSRRASPRPAADGHPHRLRSRRRGQGARRDLLPAHAPARGPGPRPGARLLGADDRVALLRAYVGERAQPPAQARPRVRAHRLPLRRRSPTTARSATCNVTACSRSSGSRCHPAHGYEVPDAGRRRRASRDALRRRDGTLGRAATTRCVDRVPRAGRVRGVARVPHPLRRCR